MAAGSNPVVPVRTTSGGKFCLDTRLSAAVRQTHGCPCASGGRQIIARLRLPSMALRRPISWYPKITSRLSSRLSDSAVSDQSGALWVPSGRLRCFSWSKGTPQPKERERRPSPTERPVAGRERDRRGRAPVPWWPDTSRAKEWIHKAGHERHRLITENLPDRLDTFESVSHRDGVTTIGSNSDLISQSTTNQDMRGMGQLFDIHHHHARRISRRRDVAETR